MTAGSETCSLATALSSRAADLYSLRAAQLREITARNLPGDQLIQNPDLANDPAIAAQLLATFLKDHETDRAALAAGDLGAHANRSTAYQRPA